MPPEESTPPDARLLDDQSPAADVTRSPASNSSPVSIAFLFYLVTLAAIISACLRTLVGNEGVTTQSITRLIVFGVVVGLVGGGLIGLFYLKGLKAMMLGTLAGVVSGAIAGCMTLVHIDRFLETTSIAFIGCWLMILFMLNTARFQSEPQL